MEKNESLTRSASISEGKEEDPKRGVTYVQEKKDNSRKKRRQRRLVGFLKATGRDRGVSSRMRRWFQRLSNRQQGIREGGNFTSRKRALNKAQKRRVVPEGDAVTVYTAIDQSVLGEQSKIVQRISKKASLKGKKEGSNEKQRGYQSLRK